MVEKSKFYEYMEKNGQVGWSFQDGLTVTELTIRYAIDHVKEHEPYAVNTINVLELALDFIDMDIE